MGNYSFTRSAYKFLGIAQASFVNGTQKDYWQVGGPALLFLGWQEDLCPQKSCFLRTSTAPYSTGSADSHCYVLAKGTRPLKRDK